MVVVNFYAGRRIKYQKKRNMIENCDATNNQSAGAFKLCIIGPRGTIQTMHPMHISYSIRQEPRNLRYAYRLGNPYIRRKVLSFDRLEDWKPSIQSNDGNAVPLLSLVVGANKKT